MYSAAGLYYLAELVEEYVVMTARVIRWATLSTIVIYVGLFLFEGFPVRKAILAEVAAKVHREPLRHAGFPRAVRRCGGRLPAGAAVHVPNVLHLVANFPHKHW